MQLLKTAALSAILLVTLAVPRQADDWYRDSDFGFVVGAGTRISLMMVDLDLEARLVYGMDNIFDSQFEYDEKHRAISLSAAILF